MEVQIANPDPPGPSHSSHQRWLCPVPSCSRRIASLRAALRGQAGLWCHICMGGISLRSPHGQALAAD